MIFRLAQFFASFFYSGYLPKAPGTWGSIFSFICILYFGLSWVTFGVVFTLGLIACQIVVQKTNIADPSWVVIDEFLGIHLAWLLYLKYGSYTHVVPTALTFIFFRIFDIWKPFPIWYIDSILLKNKHTQGLGIIIDDLIAGIFTAIAVILITPPVLGN